MSLNIDLIIKIIIPILGAIVTYFIIPWIKANTSQKQRDEVYFWVTVAVGAAEQIYKEKGQGKEKKDYVVEFLNSLGINLSLEELNVLIESSVKELNMIQTLP